MTPTVPPDADTDAHRPPEGAGTSHAATASAFLSRRRARPEVRDPHAHTRMVNLAKMALPALAAGILGLIVAWPLLQGGTETRKAGPETGQLEMLDARYLGAEKGKRPFEIRAERVTQIGGQGNAVTLMKPQAELTLDNGQWMTVSAERGRYDRENGKLTLEGEVTLFHDGGYEFMTQQAELDTEKGIAWGNVPVRGQGPSGDVDAGGFRILEGGDTIVFTGKARLRLTDVSGKKPG